jgi:putative FmdB family regulatory protein
MPIYVYRASDPTKGCEACRVELDVLQRLDESPLRRCPECGAPVEKQVARVNTAVTQGPAALRDLGFARLEKRSDGMYENVSAQPGAQRVGKLGDFATSLSKGPRPILSD